MNVIQPIYRPIARLDKRESERLRWREKHVNRLLRQAGISKTDRRQRVHKTLWDVVDRKSAASPYEALRATHVLRSACKRAGLSETNAISFTVAILQHRLPLGALAEYSPDKAFRKWREALKNLREMGLNPVGLCVLEIDLCRPSDSPAFYECHLHGVIWGASEQQVKKAFVIRRLRKGALRNRPTHVVTVTDLNTLLGYITKLEAWVHLEPTKPGHTQWPKSRLPDAEAHEWRTFISRYRVADLIKFYGMEDGMLAVEGVAELQLHLPDLSKKKRKVRGKQGSASSGGS